jgi:hypothetical protein
VVIDDHPDAPSYPLPDRGCSEAGSHRLRVRERAELPLGYSGQLGVSMRALGPHMSLLARINSAGV